MTAAGQPAIAATLRHDFGGSAAFKQRLLNFVLFVTVLTSCIAFVEPSPHDALIFVLLWMCIVAGVSFDRKLVPLLILLAVWLLGGLFSLIQVGDQKNTVQYVATSLYLDLAALTFACLFHDGEPRRLAILRQAYILSGLIATAAGLVGFFHLVPGADIFLDITPNTATFSARVSATFKDPNVYGPFLIFPLLMLMIKILTERITLGGLVLMATLLAGLFLSFSRGAWIHFVISATLCVLLLLAATHVPRRRARIIALSAAAGIAVVLLVVAMISIGPIHDIFVERAKAVQDYDVGPGGRFTLQQIALGTILDHPNGLGPFEFARINGIQQHNVYLEGFLVYGWLGGAAYLTLIAVTLVVGLQAARMPAPWQPYLAAAYAVFVGDVIEGMIVDTDHWRHFYLMLGMIWGLIVASINDRRRRVRESYAGESGSAAPVETLA